MPDFLKDSYKGKIFTDIRDVVYAIREVTPFGVKGDIIGIQNGERIEFLCN